MVSELSKSLNQAIDSYKVIDIQSAEKCGTAPFPLCSQGTCHDPSRSPIRCPPPAIDLRRLRSITEIAANLVIVCALVGGGAIWLHRGLTKSSQAAVCGPSAAAAPPAGTRVALPGVDWSAQPSTLVMAISSACPHCANEGAFYSALTRSAHRAPIVVVMPQQGPVAQSFLDAYKIAPAKTVSADLSSVQVRVTPTLLLVSRAGLVQQSWVGELSDAQQREVLTALDKL